MRIPLSWLKDFVDIPVTVEELAERLTLAGLEVAKIEYLGLPQGEPPEGVVMPPSDHLVWDKEKIVLGYIHEVKSHPDADRLVLAQVDHGTGELEQLVTGAPNLYPYKDTGKLEPPIPCPIAREGAEVYDGHSDVPGKRMVLKERKIRGIPNRHMVCSEMELGLSDEHEGVLLLNYDDFKQYEPGEPLQHVLGDVVLDLDLTPNLARCFSILGVAREVAALLNVPLHEPDYTVPQSDSNDIHQYVALDIQEPELNPRFTLAILKNVDIKPSPDWMQRRLKLLGQRPINNVVDVSNYVMFEIGQPTHAFDYDILLNRAKNNGDERATIVTRLPEDGEMLTTLDGKDYKLESHNLLVADPYGPLSMAGVMGGLESEVQEPSEDSKGSETVLLEAAAWNFINIRQTLSSTKMHSEASARFSRGVHPEVAIRGLGRTARLMAEISGATIIPGILDSYPAPAEVIQVEFPVAEVKRILGFDIPKNEVIGILEGLQFGVDDRGDILIITVPDHRLDIGKGVIGRADLLEEIARIYGYNRIPDTQIDDAIPPQHSNLDLEREERTRDLLVQAGLREVINYRLTTPEIEALLTPPELPSSWQKHEYVHLANPIASDKTVMRHTLLAGVLQNAALNARFQDGQKLFEVGSVYYADIRDDNNLPVEPLRLAILMTGLRNKSGWQADSQNPGRMDFYDLKGVVENLLAGLRIEPKLIQYVPAEHITFHPGRVARLLIGGEDMGIFGEIHPQVKEAFGLGIDLDKPVLAAELNLNKILAYSRPGNPVKPIITLPAIYQDVSIIIDRSTAAADIESAIWKAGKELLVNVELFDVYTGEQIPANKKSLTYALTYQHPEETLTDKRVAKVHGKIVKALEKTLGAQLRR